MPLKKLICETSISIFNISIYQVKRLKVYRPKQRNTSFKILHLSANLLDSNSTNSHKKEMQKVRVDKIIKNCITIILKATNTTIVNNFHHIQKN